MFIPHSPVKCEIRDVSLGQVKVSDVRAETEDLAHLRKRKTQSESGPALCTAHQTAAARPTILLDTVELYARTMDLTAAPTAGSRF